VRRGAAAALLALGLAAPAAAQIGPNGAKAYDMARAADDAARGAHDEGREAFAALQALGAPPRDAERLRPALDEAEAAVQALDAYRKQTQASADQVIEQLAEVSRGRAEPAARDRLEQRALLSAYEASVMAARTRTQAERLRALLAEARALLAGPSTGAGGAAGAERPAERAAGSGARPPAAATGSTAPALAANEVAVPNLVGGRLQDAVRDLAAAGLRLGTATGPRDGFVVNQSPAAGARVARQAAVAVTLSGTAAGSTPATPR